MRPGCQKYHVCCDDYEAVCPQPPPTVLVPSANGTTVAPGAAVTLSSLASVASPRSALFSHGGDGAPIVHSASGLCLSQAVAKERAPYTLTMFHVNQGSFAGITDMDLGDAGGDALFDFRIPSQRWACIQQGGRSQFPAQCDNPVACWAMMMMKFKLLTAVLLHPLKLITTTTKTLYSRTVGV